MRENKKEIKDVIYLVALQGLNYIAPLIVFPYLMKTLGAEKFGYIGFSLSIIQYLMLIVDFGFNFSATKRIAQAKNNSFILNDIFYSTLLAKIALLLLSFIVLLVIILGIPKFQMYTEIMLVMFIMVIGNTFSFVWLFQGLGKIKIISIINIISKLSILPLTFIFVNNPSDLLIAGLIQSSVYILGSILTIFLLIKSKLIFGKYKFKLEKIIAEIKLAYPIFLSTTATSVYTSLFIVILGYFSTPIEVGKYAAAEKIMRGFCFLIFTPISQAFYPKISTMSVTNSFKAILLTKKILLFIVIIMILLLVLLFFFSSPIASFLGKDYEGTDTIFKIMSFAPLFIASGGILGQFGLLAIGNEQDKANFQKTYFIAALVAILSVFYFVPIYLSIGASLALLITEFTVFLGMLWFNRKKFHQQKCI